MNAPTNGSDARRMIVGIALIAGPLLAVAANLVYPEDDTDEIAGTITQVIPGNTGAWETAGVLTMLSAILVVPAAMGLIHLTRRGAPRLGLLGGGLFAFGGIALFGFAVLDMVLVSMVSPAADSAQMVALAERVEETAGFVIVLAGLIGGMTLGLLVLAFALWRARVAPAWVPGMLAVSQVVFAAGQGGGKAVLVGGFVLMTLALGYVGLRVLGMGAREWEDGERGQRLSGHAAAAEAA